MSTIIATTIKAGSIADAAGTGPVTLTGQEAAKAWAYVNAGGTAILGSMNISSVTDTAVGGYTLDYTASFSSTDDLCAAATTRINSASSYHAQILEVTTSDVDTRIRRTTNDINYDFEMFMSVLGDLA